MSELHVYVVGIHNEDDETWENHRFVIAESSEQAIGFVAPDDKEFGWEENDFSAWRQSAMANLVTPDSNPGDHVNPSNDDYRESGWWQDGESACGGCGLYAYGAEEHHVCGGCDRCPECAATDRDECPCDECRDAVAGFWEHRA